MSGQTPQKPLKKQKKKTSKEKGNSSPNGPQEKASEAPPSQRSGNGALPDRDLKKNLGCG